MGVLGWPVFSARAGVFWLSFVWEVGGYGEVSLEFFLVLAVVWKELFQFSVEAFLLVEVLEVDGLVDDCVLNENRGSRNQAARCGRPRPPIV